MASACVKSIPETFLDCPPTTYGWPDISDPFKDVGDFEFRLDDPVTMLSADELFSGGKLVPLHLTAARSLPATEVLPEPVATKSEVVDPYLFSPKAPRCSSHWRELLGLRKLHQKASIMSNATTSSSSSSSNTGKSSFRQFLNRNSKSDASLNVPLLKDSVSDSVSISSSRHSISSSSTSSHDHDDLPRLSLDAADLKSYRPRTRTLKPRMVPVSETENPKPLIDHPSAPATINRAGRSTMRRANQDPTAPRGVSMDSPRLSSSGKIVFYGLERSSSSPSTFNGGPRYNNNNNKNRGMERSYSANVRVTPVLNVPLCNVFGLLSSQSGQKKEGTNGNSTVGSSKNHHHHHHHHHHPTGGRTKKDSN